MERNRREINEDVKRHSLLKAKHYLIEYQQKGNEKQDVFSKPNR